MENHTSYYIDELNKFEGSDFDNILINEKSHKNIGIYDIYNFD